MLASTVLARKLHKPKHSGAVVEVIKSLQRSMQPVFIVALMAALSLAFPVTIDCIGNDDEVFKDIMVNVCEMATNGSEPFLASDAYLYEIPRKPPSNETLAILGILSTVSDHLARFVNETDFQSGQFDAGSDALEIDMKELDDALEATDEEHWPVEVMEDRKSLQDLFGIIKNTTSALRDLRNSHTPGLELMQKAVHIDITTWIVRVQARVLAGKTSQVVSLWSRLKSLVSEIKTTRGMSRSFKRLLRAEFKFAAHTLNAFDGSKTRGRKGPKRPDRPIRPGSHG